jgi:hypothetical protein
MAIAGHGAGPTRRPIATLPPQKLADLKAVVERIAAEERAAAR